MKAGQRPKCKMTRRRTPGRQVVVPGASGAGGPRRAGQVPAGWQGPRAGHGRRILDVRGRADKKLLEPGTRATGRLARSATSCALTAITTRVMAVSSTWPRMRGTTSKARIRRTASSGVFFYDNFTKPLPVKGFIGSVVIRNKSDQEIASVPLAVDCDNDNGGEDPGGERRAATARHGQVEVQRRDARAALRFPVQRVAEHRDTPGAPDRPTSTPRPTTTGAAQDAAEGASGAASDRRESACTSAAGAVASADQASAVPEGGRT